MLRVFPKRRRIPVAHIHILHILTGEGVGVVTTVVVWTVVVTVMVHAVAVTVVVTTVIVVQIVAVSIACGSTMTTTMSTTMTTTTTTTSPNYSVALSKGSLLRIWVHALRPNRSARSFAYINECGIRRSCRAGCSLYLEIDLHQPNILSKFSGNCFFKKLLSEIYVKK
jgi:hypothetical protein